MGSLKFIKAIKMIPDRIEFGLYMLDLFTQNERMTKAHIKLITSEYSSMRSNWVYVYSGLVAEKKIKKIEEMADDEKDKLWEYAKELRPDISALTKEQAKDLCRSLVTIEYLLNLKK